jgi:hypothetical protein
VNNTQFAQFREEIITALGACIALTRLAQQFGLDRAIDMRKHLGGHIRRRSPFGGYTSCR